MQCEYESLGRLGHGVGEHVVVRVNVLKLDLELYGRCAIGVPAPNVRAMVAACHLQRTKATQLTCYLHRTKTRLNCLCAVV